MSKEGQHVIWEKRQIEIWDRIFQVISDVVVVVDTSRDSPGLNQLKEQLVKTAMAVGTELVRANASHSQARFSRHIKQARLKAIETDYWLRLMYVLRQQQDIQQDLSTVIAQYAAIINLLDKFIKHIQDEPSVIAKHVTGPKVNL